jgi:DNA-binding protein H-NS
MSNDVHALLAQRAELDRMIAQARKAERADAVAKVRSLMAEHGLTMADLSARNSTPAAKAASRKVAPKYRDPATGDTWSGRGLQPKWLRNALAAGRKLTDFAL